MKKFLTLFIAALSLSPLAHAAPLVVLAQNGTARSAIYVAPSVMAPDVKLDATATFAQTEVEMQRRRLRESVNDLAHYLEKMSSAKVRVLQSAPVAKTKTVPIFIGALAAQKFGPIKQKAMYRQGFRVVIGKSGIGLWGESDEATRFTKSSTAWAAAGICRRKWAKKFRVAKP